MTAGGIEGPQLRGESGSPDYAVAVNGVVECEDVWVNVPEKDI